MSHLNNKRVENFDTLQNYGENAYDDNTEYEQQVEDMDMDDRTFYYVSHMNKSMLIPDKWPESKSTTLHTKTLFTNENINNRQYNSENNISST